jgi:hypothetical protein
MQNNEKAEEDENDEVEIKGDIFKDLSENGQKSVIEFAASSYAVLENEQVCRIIIERYGKLDQDVVFR